LNASQNTEHIVPIFLASLKDKVPNVRFYTIKLLTFVMPYTESGTKEKIKRYAK